MIPINRLKRWPFPESRPPDAVSLEVEMAIDDDAAALTVRGALTNALGEASGAMVFELLRRLATDEAEKLGGGVPCISFNDEKGQFASIVTDGEGEVVEEGEANPRSGDEWEAGEDGNGPL
jgi:hypothetical protein